MWLQWHYKELNLQMNRNLGTIMEATNPTQMVQKWPTACGTPWIVTVFTRTSSSFEVTDVALALHILLLLATNLQPFAGNSLAIL